MGSRDYTRIIIGSPMLAVAVTHGANSWNKTINKNNHSGLDFRVFPSRNGITLTLKW
jgi:hypothetical protein